VRSWYGKYLEVLENVGWVADQFAFSGYNQDEGEFHMDEAAIGIISAIATGNQLAVLQSSVEALRKLSDGEKPIKVFEYYASSQDAGNFQLGSVQQGTTGTTAQKMTLNKTFYAARRAKVQELIGELADSYLAKLL